MQAQAGQAGGGGAGEVAVNVDAGHLARAVAGREQRRAVPGTGAHVQDARPVKRRARRYMSRTRRGNVADEAGRPSCLAPGSAWSACTAPTRVTSDVVPS